MTSINNVNRLTLSVLAWCWPWVVRIGGRRVAAWVLRVSEPVLRQLDASAGRSELGPARRHA